MSYGRRIGLQRRAVPVVRGDDGLVDAVRRVVGEFDQEQQLRKGVVLAVSRTSASQRLVIASSCGKSQLTSLSNRARGSVRSRRPAEVFFQRELGQQEGDLVQPAALQLVERVDARLAHDRGILGLGRDVGRGEGELGSLR